MFESFMTAFASLFVIMNPFSSLVPFIMLTKDQTAAERARSANLASLVAGVLAVSFLFAGPIILTLMALSLSSFKIAGGIVLVLLGLQTVLGVKLSNAEEPDKEAVAVLIGTPLLTGPGVLTSVILMSEDHGALITFFAILASVAISWLILRGANRMQKAMGRQMLLVVVKIMGLLLVTRGVQFVIAGLAKP
ncbi:MAG: MarC family protein [Candidatus Micrarchaeota archaeon]